MTSIPASLARVPTLLRSNLLLASINRSNLDLLTVQTQLASGQQVSKFSDDPIAASAINVLRDRLAQGAQIQRNLTSGQATVDYLDSSIGDATDLVREAQSIASSQIGITSDAATRSTQATIIDGYIQQLYLIGNRSSNGLYIFGGATATQPPFQEVNGGYRYVGQGSGMYAQLGAASDVPITIGADGAIGEVSARVQSVKDLNPALTPGLRLSELGGARNLGIAKGSVDFSFNGGPTATVDLSNADTVQGVVAALTGAIRKYESDNSTTVLGPGGVSVSNGSISIDVVPGAPTNPSLTFTDAGLGVVGKDLGLTQNSFSAASPLGADLNPKITPLTPLSSIPGLTVPPGTIRFRFTSGAGSSVTDVDLSSATTVDDLRNLIETQVPGVRVQINDAGNSINILSEVSGPDLSIEPTGTGPDTATELGIRTLSAETKISDFNGGRGVQIVDNATDPVSGLKTRQYNSDFRVTLGNGQAFDVDLRPQDMGDVQSVLARINSEFNSAVGQPPVIASAPPLASGQFSAGLATTGNGITFTQTVAGAAISVAALNNSAAAEDLGLASATYDASSATLTAQDRAGVRVNNLFTSLIRLRDALQNNDSSGITVAGDDLGAAVDRLSGSQALVGVYSNRLQQATTQQEDQDTVSEKMRSELQDLDFSQATIRFNTLRTQLQATYQAASLAGNLSLLDFLH